MRGDTLRRQLARDERIPYAPHRDDADVGGVAFVARAGVRDVDQPHPHGENIATLVVISRLSTRAGQYATTSSIFGRPPAKPVTLGGPLSTRGAISLVKRSTVARSGDRTPTRSCTSGASRPSPASAPCVAVAPRNSVWISSKRRPRRSSRCRSTRSATRAFSIASGHT